MPTTGTIRRGMPTPPEVLAYFREKRLAPRYSWQDISGQEHAHAFTVAGVVEARILAEFKAAIDKALTEGWGFEKFREEMQRRLTPHGWWGPKQVEDPEARWRPKTVNFAVPARLQTTFWSNMRAARAAGQWARIQRTKDSRPFLLYIRSASERKRPEHLRWVGTILPVDHPFWATHFPPNGWGCKCSVRQISAAERQDYLDRPESDDPDAISYSDEPPPTPTRTWRNRRTGERVEVPAGIDPGWQTNPGIARGRTLGGILADQLDATPVELARGRVARLLDSDGFRAFASGARDRAAAGEAFAGDTMAVARLSDDVAKQLGVRPTVSVPDAAAATYPEATWSAVQQAVDRGALRSRPDGRYALAVEVGGRVRNLVLSAIDGRLTVDPAARRARQPRREWPWEPIPARDDVVVNFADRSVQIGRDLKLWSESEDARSLIGRMMAGVPAEEVMETTVASRGGRVEVWGVSRSGRVRITRSFEADPDAPAGGTKVSHDYFVLDTAYQGSGHARTMMRASVEEYVRRGITKIEVHANIDVGGYSWARLGFRPRHPDQTRRLLAERVAWGDMPAADQAILRGIIERASDADLMYDLARATNPDGRKIGKDMLLGSDWFGVIDLTDPAVLARLKEALK